MIDVIFLLLIFFMCTSATAPQESELTAQIPVVRRAASTSDELEPIHIRVQAGGEARYYCNRHPCQDRAALIDSLRKRWEIADVPVIIEGEQQVAFEEMVQVLNLALEIGFERVAFAVNP